MGTKTYYLGYAQVTLAANGRSISTENGLVKATVTIREEKSVEYLDLALSSLNGRYPAGGMLGRTLEKPLADATAFNDYRRFLQSREEMYNYRCHISTYDGATVA